MLDSVPTSYLLAEHCSYTMKTTNLRRPINSFTPPDVEVVLTAGRTGRDRNRGQRSCSSPNCSSLCCYFISNRLMLDRSEFCSHSNRGSLLLPPPGTKRFELFSDIRKRIFFLCGLFIETIITRRLSENGPIIGLRTPSVVTLDQSSGLQKMDVNLAVTGADFRMGVSHL